MATHSFEKFAPYVQRLQALSTACVSNSGYRDWAEKASRALDGEPSSELRLRVPLGARRALGTFFTGSFLAGLVLEEVHTAEIRHAIFYDPSCGAGDLLIAAARKLPVSGSLTTTLKKWAASLHGMDVQAQFVSAAKARLLLLARHRLGLPKSERRYVTQSFSQVRRGDALKHIGGLSKATIILLNPPFSPTTAPRGCEWASGSVNTAAVFVHSVISRARPGTKIIAILPEVLRTGSRYDRWRDEVSSLARVKKIRRYGVFDSSADVDVFIGVFVKRKSKTKTPVQSKWRGKFNSRKIVKQQFLVAVGPVVPFRHRPEGPARRYLHPRNAPGWKTIKRITEKRCFERPLFKPPFVVIRRTSRPGDKHRAVASIVTGKEAVAVENHLIICKPLKGGLGTCQELLRFLKSDAATRFLNERMRCRHLTVASINELPYQSARRRTSSKR